MMECTGNIAFINDRQVSCREVEQQSFEGLAVYEIFRVIDGIPVFLEDHLERLYYSLDLEGKKIGETESDIADRVRRLIEANGMAGGKIKMVVVFAAGGEQGSYDIWMYFTPFEPPSQEQYSKGVPVILCSAVRDDPNAKVMGTRARRLADARIQQTGAYEALLLDQRGYITEGSRSNVFFIQGEKLVTPPDSAVLQGIARKNILRICQNENLAVEIRKIHQNELAHLNGAFLSGTTPQILPIQAIEQTVFSVNHPLIRHLIKAYQQRLENYIHLRKLSE